MKKHGSLTYQTIQKMKTLQRIGESKHAAKKEEKEKCVLENQNWNPSKVPGIFTYKSFETYKYHAMKFIGWIKQNYPEIKKIESITQMHVDEYITVQISAGNSPSTLHTLSSAIAKVFNVNSSVKLPRRSYKSISRSRKVVNHDMRINLDNYEDEIHLATACGCRRRGLEHLKAGDIKYLGGKIAIYLKEKGGRERYATVLKNHMDWVRNFISDKNPDELLFGKVTNLLDIHSFRRKYAELRYLELAAFYGEKFTLKTRDGRLFDKQLLQIVTEDMGHNRIGVLTCHYLDNPIFQRSDRLLGSSTEQ